MDPEFRKISEKFRDDHEAFKDAFARAWFKLTHRDMGPKARYLGPEVPAEDLIWQDPVPAGTMPSRRATSRRSRPRSSAPGSAVGQLVKTAWASASTYRQLRPSRRRQRRAHPARAAEGLGGQRARRAGRVSSPRSTSCAARLSMADAIVLGRHGGGREGGEGRRLQRRGAVHRRPRRRDSGADRRRELRGARARGRRLPQLPQDQAFSVRTEELLIDRAQLLGLSAPEMTVLVGGLRVLGANYEDRSTACSPTARAS